MMVMAPTAIKKVPASCCKLDTSGEKVDCESKNPVDLDEIYQNDCFVEAVVFVRGHATIIGGVAVAIASIMILGMVFSICHYKLIAKWP
jgi:hypothetical protein